MAIRVAPKLLQSLSSRQFARALSSAPSSIPVLPLNFDEKPEATVSKPPETQSPQSSILDLDDTQKLFSSFSTKKLLKSSVNLNMAAVDRVIDLGIWVMRSKLMETPVFRDVILGAVKHSFYEQFVAGEDLYDTGRTINKIYEDGLKAMLNYGLEHAYDNEACDRSFEAFYKTIEFASSLPKSSIVQMETNYYMGPTNDVGRSAHKGLPSCGSDVRSLTPLLVERSWIWIVVKRVYMECQDEEIPTSNTINIFCKNQDKLCQMPNVSFVIVKISAIFPMELLERLSDLLRWEKQDPSFHLPWKQNTLPIFGDSSPLYHTLERPPPLTQEEEKDLQLALERFNKLCRRCIELEVPLTVDAEDTNIQPAIDYLTYNASINYNKEGGSGPIVYGTIQAYLKDAKERLSLATEAARKMGLPMGFKIVRGAYMSSESKLANSLGFESPIHNTIQDTHDCYNDCASFMLDRVVDGSGAVVLATHNVESGRLAATKARDLGIGRGNDRLQFAQLYGMSEALSYGLKNAGFQVSKYLTFGPVEEVIPYLLRRAEENRGVLSSSSLDRQLMGKELKRRLKSGF